MDQKQKKVMEFNAMEFSHLRANQFDKPKILMVDDKPENLLALEKLLKDLPVDLYKAESGNEALRLTLYHDFALALLDIQMPEMDGYELASILRQEEKTARLPFIFISAIYTERVDIFEGYEKGAFSFITKPFEPGVLLSKIRFFIDKFQQEQVLKLKTQELQRMNNELETFCYTVSHDLRSPLRAINGFTNILLEDHSHEFSDDTKAILQVITSNSTKMSQLIDDILNFSHLQQVDVKKESINMTSLFKEVYEELILPQASRQVVFKLKPLPEAQGDKSMVRQVAVNLLDNAIKYTKTKNKARIEVSGYGNGKDNFFEVKDNGVGFNKAYEHKLFGVFQRLHNRKEFEGTGVGLAIVQRVVERHGGRVWGTGEIDKGATFGFTIPKIESQ